MASGWRTKTRRLRRPAEAIFDAWRRRGPRDWQRRLVVEHPETQRRSGIGHDEVAGRSPGSHLSLSVHLVPLLLCGCSRCRSKCNMFFNSFAFVSPLVSCLWLGLLKDLVSSRSAGLVKFLSGLCAFAFFIRLIFPLPVVMVSGFHVLVAV